MTSSFFHEITHTTSFHLAFHDHRFMLINRSSIQDTKGVPKFTQDLNFPPFKLLATLTYRRNFNEQFQSTKKTSKLQRPAIAKPLTRSTSKINAHGSSGCCILHHKTRNTVPQLLFPDQPRFPTKQP